MIMGTSEFTYYVKDIIVKNRKVQEKVFSGDQQAAMGAFMQGKVKFSGDMGLGQKLGSVFKAPE